MNHSQTRGLQPSGFLPDLALKIDRLSDSTKRLVMMSADVTALVAAIALAYWIRMGFGWLPQKSPTYIAIFMSLALSPVILNTAGLYRLISRYVTAHVVQQTVFAVTFTTLSLVLAAKIIGSSVELPRTVIFLYWFISLTAIYGLRMMARWLMNHSVSTVARQIAIYGAGEAGHELAQALKVSSGYRTLLFIDNDPALWGRQIGDATVLSPDQFKKKYTSGRQSSDIEEILIALPSASREEIRRVNQWAENFPQRVRRLPPISELTNGDYVFDQLVGVSVEDVAGRDSVPADRVLLEENVRGLNVFVTGAGGSIGSEICRQALLLGAKSLVLYENSENHLYQIDRRLRDLRAATDGSQTEIIPVLGSVVDGDRILSCMRKNAIDTVFHAAAYKHVPLVESNPSAALVNNSLGTAISAIAARTVNVRTFVLVSTDKAVRPTNVMGASKRIAEMLVQLCAESDRDLSENLSRIFDPSDHIVGPKIAAHNIERVSEVSRTQSDVSTRFVIVRFGNVLDSSGSVIPLFREQILNGGPVTVTHPEVNRYFMSIPEAAELVIQAGALGENGDVHLLDMGDPVKIVDLATRLIRMAGYRPTREKTDDPTSIEIVFTGLRPGEKLYEELLIGSEAQSTRHPRIFQATERDMTSTSVNTMIPELLDLCREQQQDASTVRDFLSRVVHGYRPENIQAIGPSSLDAVASSPDAA